MHLPSSTHKNLAVVIELGSATANSCQEQVVRAHFGWRAVKGHRQQSYPPAVPEFEASQPKFTHPAERDCTRSSKQTLRVYVAPQSFHGGAIVSIHLFLTVVHVVRWCFFSPLPLCLSSFLSAVGFT